MGEREFDERDDANPIGLRWFFGCVLGASVVTAGIGVGVLWLISRWGG